MKQCKHNWVFKSVNTLGVWYDCTKCKTTSLALDIKEPTKFKQKRKSA